MSLRNKRSLLRQKEGKEDEDVGFFPGRRISVAELHTYSISRHYLGVVVADADHSSVFAPLSIANKRRNRAVCFCLRAHFVFAQIPGQRRGIDCLHKS